MIRSTRTPLPGGLRPWIECDAGRCAPVERTGFMKKPTVTVESRRIPPCTEWKHDTGMWCLFLVEHGRGVFQTAAFSHAIHLGDLGVLPTGTRGFFKAVPETEVSITSLHFVPESLSGPLSLGTRLIL